MKYFLLNLIFISLFFSCEGGTQAVDEFLGKGNVVIVEAPLDLDLTIDSPSIDGMAAGYSTVMEGTCTLAGSVVRITGDSTAFGICGIDLRWSATVDLSMAPLGTITLDATLTNGAQQSDTETRTLIKSSTTCDTLAARTATFAAGTGTPGDPYMICTGTQLSNIRTSLTSSYELATDIELYGTPFNPLGNFSGNFEGNGFSIIDLNINSTGIDQVGFFSQLIGTNQTIQNVEFRNAIISGDQRVGVLVGRINNAGSNVVLDNIIIQATITGTDNLGGLVGQALNYSSLTVTNYSFEGSLSNIGSNVGGMAGFTRAVTFNNATLTTSINSQGSNAGGAIGYLEPVAGTASIISNISVNYTNGSSTDLGNRSGVGGLVGNCRNANDQRINSFTNITAHSVVNVSGANAMSYIGGVFGICGGNTFDTITGSLDLNLNTTSDASDSAGGIAGRIYFDRNNPIIMTDWTSTNTDISGNINRIGGLAGYVERYDGHNSTISGVNFHAQGVIDSYNLLDRDAYIGGLFGGFVMGNNSSRVDLSNLSWSGDISGFGRFISGGFGDIYVDANSDTLSLDSINIQGDITVNHNGGTDRHENHGGLAGRIYLNTGNTLELSNFALNNNITRSPTTLADYYLGGIAGQIYGNSTNTVRINGTNSSTGNISGAGHYFSKGFGYIYLRNSPVEISVSDITLTGDITHSEAAGERNYLGGFAGYINVSTSDFTISNITYNGNILLNGFANNVGGFAGAIATANNAFNNTVTNVRNLGSNITNCLRFCGGVVGTLNTNNAAGYLFTFENLYNRADITSIYTAGNDSHTGGLIAYINQRSYFLYNSENYGDVTSSRNVVGGLIGYGYNRNNQGEVVGNSNLGRITGRDYVGGLIGRSRVYLNGNMNTGNVIGEDQVGGLVGRVENFNSNALNTFENYSVGNVFYDDTTASSSQQGILVGARGHANNVDNSNYYLSSRNLYDSANIAQGNISGLGQSRTDAQLSSLNPAVDLPGFSFGAGDGQWTIAPLNYELPNATSYSYPIPSGL